MSGLEFEGISRHFGSTAVLSDITLQLNEGEFLALLGASGSGKSTLLRIAAGLDTGYTGRVRIDGRLVDAIPPSRRDVAMVFQDYALYPHLSVRENIALPLEMRRLNTVQRLPGAGLLPAVRARRQKLDLEVRKVAVTLGLETVLRQRPAELSGGQRQRAALGRAVVRRPRVFLMDEPLSNLDASLRTTLRAEIRRVQRDSGASCLYVTHDQVEAMTMADRIAVLADGSVLQVGTPRDVFSNPAHLRVLDIVGSPPANVIPAADPALAGTADTLPRQCAFVAVRPEKLQPGHEPGDGSDGLRLRAWVRSREDHGHSVWYEAELPDSGHRVGWIGSVGDPPGDTVELTAPISALWLFDKRGRRIGFSAGSTA